MPAWRREADAVITRELGSLPHAVSSFVARSPSPAARSTELADAARGLAADGTLVVMDHNRPRRRLMALLALLRSPRIPGIAPRGRWRRPAYPTAREVQTVGFRVERLRLVAGERVQIVFARRRELVP
jgi:hypothetical protein